MQYLLLENKMSTVSLQEIEHLAHLARLKLTQEQKESLVWDMENILWLIGKLEEVNVDDVSTDWFPHIDHHMKLQEWVEQDKNSDAMLQNVKHPLKDKAIVVKSSL